MRTVFVHSQPILKAIRIIVLKHISYSASWAFIGNGCMYNIPNSHTANIYYGKVFLMGITFGNEKGGLLVLLFIVPIFPLLPDQLHKAFFLIACTLAGACNNIIVYTGRSISSTGGGTIPILVLIGRAIHYFTPTVIDRN
jgi:hypothetical protein